MDVCSVAPTLDKKKSLDLVDRVEYRYMCLPTYRSLHPDMAV